MWCEQSLSLSLLTTLLTPHRCMHSRTSTQRQRRRQRSPHPCALDYGEQSCALTSSPLLSSLKVRSLCNQSNAERQPVTDSVHSCHALEMVAHGTFILHRGDCGAAGNDDAFPVGGHSELPCRSNTGGSFDHAHDVDGHVGGARRYHVVATCDHSGWCMFGRHYGISTRSALEVPDHPLTQVSIDICLAALTLCRGTTAK